VTCLRVVAPRAIDPRVAWQLQSMMRDVVKRGTATDAKVLGREDVGGKTVLFMVSGCPGPMKTTCNIVQAFDLLDIEDTIEFQERNGMRPFFAGFLVGFGARDLVGIDDKAAGLALAHMSV